MKKLILASIALLLVFAVVPAMAGDKSSNSPEPAAFQALSKLSTLGQTDLNKMTDEQLAAVEGQSSRFSFQKNIAFVFQRNTCIACLLGVLQTNGAVVTQIND